MSNVYGLLTGKKVFVNDLAATIMCRLGLAECWDVSLKGKFIVLAGCAEQNPMMKRSIATRKKSKLKNKQRSRQ